MSNQTSSGRLVLRVPKPEVIERKVEVPKYITVEKEVIVEKEVEKKCLKNCCPKLSYGCDCGVSCKDYYLNPLCNFVGITGLLEKDQCIVYDELWGGCSTCIGCKDDCAVDVCPLGNPFGSTPGLLNNPIGIYGSAAFGGLAQQQYFSQYGGAAVPNQVASALNQFGQLQMTSSGQLGLNAQQVQALQFNQVNQNQVAQLQQQQMIHRQQPNQSNIILQNANN